MSAPPAANTTPAAVISDIHGNSPALRAVLADIDATGIERIWVGGDIINGVDPAGCLSLLKERKSARCVKGNAEAYLCTPDLDALPSKLRLEGLVDSLRWWQGGLTEDLLSLVCGYPDEIVDGRMYLVHDSPIDRERVLQINDDIPAKYREIAYHGQGLHPRSLEETWHHTAAAMERRGADVLFCGHTHLPYVHRMGGKTVCNTGSLGLPLCGDVRATWVLWDGDTDLQFRLVDYDVEETVSMVKKVGYPAEDPERYVAMLREAKHWRQL